MVSQALVVACQEKNIDMVDVLLSPPALKTPPVLANLGACLTPVLHEAAQHGEVKVIRQIRHSLEACNISFYSTNWLLEATRRDDRTFLEVAAIYLQWPVVDDWPHLSDIAGVVDRNGYTILHWAVALRQIDRVRRYLVDPAVTRNLLTNSPPLLHVAIRYNHIIMVRLLLDFLDQPAVIPRHTWSTQQKYETMWHVAAQYGRLDIARFLFRQAFQLPDPRGRFRY